MKLNLSHGLRRCALVLLVAALALVAEQALGCPNCKEGLASADPQGRSLAAGFYYSILFMMSMPFAILGTFGAFAYRAVQKNSKNAS